ncbi:hypothetical protein MTR67_016399 [Solanum verrucosum]|uniref:Cytochrome c domain-containing protein n=1 Tax=Solanum verrucosum TaxID=315347 RepID=A0AAF0QNC0_SOLVR|nr:hypothetical protein MTR67_016399 [Solanum verrucosum]
MGDYVLEFGRILDYKDELLRTNPGSTCVVKLYKGTFENGKKMFQGFYICFDAMKKSFLAGCRKCIGLDCCFLKGVSKGQLLVVVCKDENNQMLPLAWAVVEVENKFTWAWFVKLLKEDLQLGDGTHITIISAMQKGLEISITDHLPNVEHRMCARHILANWSKSWRGIERKKCFWRCARSTFEDELKDNISYMKRNNMAEYFNSWILAARHKTIITMLEEIRVKMMKKIGQMREFCNTWICDIFPMAMKVLQENTAKSMKCNIEWNSDTGYERNIHEDIQLLYSAVMNLKMWPESQNISVIPPHVRKMPGRLGKKRKKEQGETSKTEKLSKRGIEMSCNTCHNKDHNKRKCHLGAPAYGTSFTAGPSLRPAAGPSSRPPSGLAAAPTSTQTAGLKATLVVAPTSTDGPRATPNAPTGRGRGRTKGSTENVI